MKPLIDEVWGDIPGYVGMYQASTSGRVRSCSRYVFRRGRCGELHALYRPAKLLTPKKRGEYLAVKLWRPDGGVFYSVHRIVAETFLGVLGDEVNHKDEDKYNNSLENLEWCDKSYNQRYSKGPTLIATRYEQQVIVKGVREMAKELGVGRSSIQRMLSGKCKSVKGWEVYYQIIN